MQTSNLFPYVVPKCYLHIPGVDEAEQPALDKWGIVRPLGPDLFRMLIERSEGLVRNVHESALQEIGLTVEEAQAIAIGNLRQLASRRENIERRLSLADNGTGHAVWMGHWLTASCIVLPELHEWARRHLKTGEVLVSAPQGQFLFLFTPADRTFRDAMTQYIQKVVDGMEKLITPDLFLLTESGLTPHIETDAS